MSAQPEVTRRQALGTLSRWAGGLMAFFVVRQVKATVRTAVASGPAPSHYDPSQHSWRMAIDIDKCIGCGMCVVACKAENKVPPQPSYFRTWVERYIIRKPKPGGEQERGSTFVDSPNGGMDGFPLTHIPKEDILKSFFVPKLCNQCHQSPCVKACPVGATFDTPDGAVLVDNEYCIGCGFCVQSCPYGCRYIRPSDHTADKCSFCYHRITRGLKPACVEVCPTGARVFGDLKNPVPNDPLQAFYQKHKVNVLKPHLGTHARVYYAGLDKEVN